MHVFSLCNLIRWPHQKPADLDLQCFLKKDKAGFSRTRLELIFNSFHLEISFIVGSPREQHHYIRSIGQSMTTVFSLWLYDR